MNAPTDLTGVQTLSDAHGKPLFVVLPVAEYLRLRRCHEPTLPNEVVTLMFEGAGMSVARAWREHLQLTQATLAERMGISQAALAQIESARQPRRQTRERLAQALGIQPEQLLAS